MYSGKLVFAQLMEHLPLHTFRRCVQRYPSKYPTKTFSHLDQFLCLAFAQLTFRESLRDIETCLRAHQDKRPSKCATPYCKIQTFSNCCCKLILNWLRNRELADVSVAVFSIVPTIPVNPAPA